MLVPLERDRKRSFHTAHMSCCLLGKTEDCWPFSRSTLLANISLQRAHLGLCQEPSLIGVPISRSCQRQANSLRRWLELSQEEPKSEDLHLEEQVKTELEEVRPGQPRASPWLSFLSACLVPPSRPCPQVELQVQQLAKELEAQRQPVGTCIARVRALRRALC